MSELKDRFTARRLDLRRHRWLRIVLVVLAVVLVGVLAWLIWFSSVLAVRSVQIEGQTTLKAQQVRSTAEVQVGEPLARADLTAIQTRVKTMPRVRLVEVSRSWPRTVTIKITERTAVVWATVEGQVHGIDRFGVDYRRFSKAPDGLVEAKVGATDPERRIETLGSVAAIADTLRREDPALNKQVQAIVGSTKDSISLDLTKGRTVTWGSEAEGRRKIEVLKTLLKIDAQGYDVSAPDQPTTRD